MQNKFQGLAGVVESIGKGEHSKEYKSVLDFINKNVIQIDDYKRNKILTALKSFPRIRMAVSVQNFNSETMTANDK